MLRITVIVTTIAIFCAISSSSCGEDKTICQEAIEVRMTVIKEMCDNAKGRDDCNWLCPCECVKRGHEFRVLMTAQGIPDLEESYCFTKKYCTEYDKGVAQDCLDNPDRCAGSGSQGFSPDFTFLGVPFCGPDSPITEPFPMENCAEK